MLVMWMKRNITLRWLDTHVVLNLITFGKNWKLLFDSICTLWDIKVFGSWGKANACRNWWKVIIRSKAYDSIKVNMGNLPGLDIVEIDVLINYFDHFITLFWSSFPLIIFGGLEKMIFYLLKPTALSHCHTHTHFPTEICSVCLSSSLSRMRTSNFCYTITFIISDSLIIFIVLDAIDVRLGALLWKIILYWLLMMSWTTK